MPSLQVKEAAPTLVKKTLNSLSETYSCRFGLMFEGFSFFLTISRFSQLLMFKGDKVQTVLSSLKKLGLHPYSLGIPVAILQPHVEPMLPFGNFMSPVCRKLSLEGEQLYTFLYGRKIKIDSNEPIGNVVVTDGSDEFVGYGLIFQDKKGDRGLKPLRDLGWYLRQGG